MSSRLHNLFFKYKLLHVIMWFLIGAFMFITYYDTVHSIPDQITNALVICVIYTIPFYTTAYVLVPRLLYKRKFAVFIGSLLIMIIVMSLTNLLVVRYFRHVFDSNTPIFPSWDILGPEVNLFIWNTILTIFVAGGLKILSDRFRIEKKLHEVEKEKISTELNFLRSQVNPHFLFNVMNTIYFQIDKENIPARASVEKLSEMLRYQLYECITDKIDIGKELEYIKNYVAMQSLRMEKGTDIRLCIDDNLSGFFIAPLLLLPIIENAFKHISNFKNPEENKIHISLQNENDRKFSVQVTNTYDKSINTKHLLNSSGLGMQNLKRRLDLLYPNKHLFNINQRENLFETTLKIQYDD